MILCFIFNLKIGDNSNYLDSGPPFLILLHPALGPLWEVTRQKVSLVWPLWYISSFNSVLDFYFRGVECELSYLLDYLWIIHNVFLPSHLRTYIFDSSFFPFSSFQDCSFQQLSIILQLCLSLICQFCDGSISKGSELQVEVAEFLWSNVQVSNILTG